MAAGVFTLGEARYIRFQKQAAKGKIDPDRLPPTEDAASQHVLRVYLHVVVWRSLDTSVLQPIGRGWEVDGSTGRLRPKMLTGAIAPDSLLQGICCNCGEGERGREFSRRPDEAVDERGNN